MNRQRLIYAARKQGVCCWGDSLTAGAESTDPLVNSYPPLLAQARSRWWHNGGVGGYTSTQIKTAFLASSTEFKKSIQIFWAGRNNYADPVTVLADLAAMVAGCTHDRYLVLNVINGQNRPDENIGQSNYELITDLNADIAALYDDGSRYLAIREALVASYDSGIPQDVIDHGNDVPPSSKSADGLHLNDAGYAFVATTVNAKIAANGWW